MSRQPTSTAQITAQHIVLAQSIIDNWHVIQRESRYDRLLLDGIGFPNDREIILCVTYRNGLANPYNKYIPISLELMYLTGREHLHDMVAKIVKAVNDE